MLKLFNDFRIKYHDTLPIKLHSMLNYSILSEIRIMNFSDGLFFNSNNIYLNKNDCIKDYIIKYYKFCKNESIHIEVIKQNIDINRSLFYIPVSLYYFDNLDLILDSIVDYPDFGIDLPPGHQCVIISYKGIKYFYDPEGCDIKYINKLKELFPNIIPISDYIQDILDDNFCMLHTINFMKKVYDNPKKILHMNEETKDVVYKRLFCLCKNLI